MKGSRFLPKPLAASQRTSAARGTVKSMFGTVAGLRRTPSAHSMPERLVPMVATMGVAGPSAGAAGGPPAGDGAGPVPEPGAGAGAAPTGPLPLAGAPD